MSAFRWAYKWWGLSARELVHVNAVYSLFNFSEKLQNLFKIGLKIYGALYHRKITLEEKNIFGNKL